MDRAAAQRVGASLRGLSRHDPHRPLRLLLAQRWPEPPPRADASVADSNAATSLSNSVGCPGEARRMRSRGRVSASSDTLTGHSLERGVAVEAQLGGAKRTIEGRLVPMRSARSETVPKASSVGSATTTSAIRRSVGVSCPLALAISSATVTGDSGSPAESETTLSLSPTCSGMCNIVQL